MFFLFIAKNEKEVKHWAVRGCFSAEAPSKNLQKKKNGLHFSEKVL